MDDYRLRVRLFSGIIVLVLGILGGRLAQLQLIDRDDFLGEARSNALREQRVLSSRGAIYDRAGQLLVDNELTYTITLTPRYFAKDDESAFSAEKVRLLAGLLAVPDSAVYAELDEARGWNAFRPSFSFREVPFARYARVRENLWRLPGVGYEVEQKRRYHTEARASHVMGYIREIGDRELSVRRSEGYRQGDLIGKTGIEKNYESYLRGRPGSAFKVVNVHGLEVMSYRDGVEDLPPVSGFNLRLTIDHRVQALAESLFVGKRGGAVALDPKTGGILALVSSPDYDPEIFTQSVDAETWGYLNNSPQKPLLNRATMNLMPPGSTWKPFMSLMALQEGYIKPDETVMCRGGHSLGRGRYFTCMGVHGPMTVETAIQNSCNTFFFEMMYRADVNTFSRYAHLFGFGERAPLEIDEQTPGLIPDSAYFRQKTGTSNWGPGWTLSLGIGQGDMGVTPMQLARYIAAVANKGTLLAPHVVASLENPDTGETVYPALPAPEEIPVDEAYFDQVHDGMRRVMEFGTGRLMQLKNTALGDIPSAGKTGTAQAPGIDRDDNSLFVFFAPLDDPQIAIAVEVENAGYGGSAAAPIASLMAELYLTGEISDAPNRQFVLRRALNARSQPLPGEEESPES